MDERNNSGQHNSGNYNSGHYNSGHRNSGNRNSGNYNSWHRNSGNRNSGNHNSGDCNSGHGNSGHGNSGNCNSGDCNSGHRNSGHGNSGHRNSGHHNSGDCNSGNCNSGFFCTETPQPTFFDQPVDMSWEDARELIPWIDLPVGCRWVSESEMTDEEKAANPNHATIGGYLKVLEKDFRVAFPQAWAKLDDETKQKFIDLPNFDAEKFLTITGVYVRVKPSLEVATNLATPYEVTVNGRRYVLAD